MLVSTGKDLTEQVRPPRSLFVNAPLGNPFGPAHEPAIQREILLAALALSSCEQAGVMLDFPFAWPEDFSSKVEKSLLAMGPA